MDDSPRILRGTAFLVVSRHRGFPAKLKIDRVTKRAPALARDEIALQVEMRVPAEYFERPSLRAVIEVSPGDLMQTVDVQQVAEQVRQATGLEIVVVEPEQEGD